MPHSLQAGKREVNAILLALAWLVAAAFAVNIGASGTAAAMGCSYGSHVIRRRPALLLVACFALLGAWWGGQPVLGTLSEGIVPPQHVTPQAAMLIMLAATTSLLAANLLGIPLSTSEVTVGALVGAGLAFNDLHWARVMTIVLAWAVLPLVVLAASYGLTRLCRPLVATLVRGPHPGRSIHRMLALLLIAGGCYESFAAGMNNVGNVVAPLVAAGLLGPATGVLWGGALLAVGALTLGGRVLETNGKKITDLSLFAGAIVSLTAGTLVVALSEAGLPVPLTQATTVAIVGTGIALYGSRGVQLKTVKRIAVVWLVSPLLSLVTAYFSLLLSADGAVFVPRWTTLNLVLLLVLVIVGTWQVARRGRPLGAKRFDREGGTVTAATAGKPQAHRGILLPRR